ncbi:hypothetical protein [Chromobacterium violaceum]|uniref:hypothetical protein n=1 Tax=Chromobacterium violaceum TaxID=536 RepID=UPI00194F3A55|nr:hypothetical protein [Chromobacterium violaceum]QRO32601.1 hypothetical protein I6K04_19340 [Chromobacterium violaceum]QRQ17598.1 hypothetical protein I6K03_03385 [Chromobacterium violaceum]
MMLATPHQPRHNYFALVNPSAGLGGPDKKADSRLAAIFTSVVHTICTPFSMAGSGGGVHARTGSFLPVRQPCHLPASPLGGEESGFSSRRRLHMPSISLRAPRAHLSVHPVPEKAATALIKQSKSSNANGIGIPFALRQMSMVDIAHPQPMQALEASHEHQ